MKQQLQKEKIAAAHFVLNKNANTNNVVNEKWLPIEEQIKYSPAVMGFKAICVENVPNHLKLTQQVTSSRNVRSNNKGLIKIFAILNNNICFFIKQKLFGYSPSLVLLENIRKAFT